MRHKVLLVDDDPALLELYKLNLEDRFPVDTALGGSEALKRIRNDGPYAVIVADMKMPDMTGIEFLMQAEVDAPDTVRLILTGHADQHTAIEAVNKGHIYRFLTKPCSTDVLTRALEAGISQYRLVTAERELLEKTVSGSIKVLTEILSMVESQIFGYAEKLRDYMGRFARHLHIENHWELEAAAMLSQIGYVTIPAQVLKKLHAGTQLSGPERDMIARVPLVGSDLVANIPRLENVSQIILYQNKQFDGSGFPVDSVMGEYIPVGARMLKVLADLIQFENRGLSKEQALEKMRQRSGFYDNRILEAAFACFQVQLNASARRTNEKFLNLNDLRIGQTLLADVETKDGMLVIGAGNRITQMLLGRLRNFARIHGIKEPLHVEDD